MTLTYAMFTAYVQSAKAKQLLKVLCAVMDLPKPPTRFQKYNEIIGKATEEVAECSMIEAARCSWRSDLK